MHSDVIRVGLLGLGAMGQNHLRVLSILKNVDLAFVYDTNLSKAETLAAAHNTTAVSTLAEAWKTPVDAVVICTPTSTHAAYIHEVSAHVRHIFVEKPMATSLAQAEDIVRIVAQKNLHLQVGFIERFNPAVQQLKRVLDISGGVISLDFTRTNKLSERITDVDVISDLMIHDIDLALYINGPVRALTAHGVVDGNGRVAFVVATLQHACGRFSRLLASRITEKKIRRIEATCNGVFVDCELLRKEIVLNRQSEIRYQNGEHGEAYRISAIQENIEVVPQEALLLEQQSFIASCAGHAVTILPTAQDTLAAIRMAEEIRHQVLHP